MITTLILAGFLLSPYGAMPIFFLLGGIVAHAPNWLCGRAV